MSGHMAIQQAHQLFRNKYGWQMRAFDFFSTLGGRIGKRAYICIDVPG